jgi:pilus assembly protein CpaE
VVVVDLDLLFGHVAMLLDLAPRSALAAISPSAMRQIDRDGFAYYLTKHPESSLRVMVGTLRPEESELVTGEHVRTLLELLRKQYMHVVVDAGSRFSEPCLAAIELADEVMVVCTPESHALHDMLECQRVLHDLLGYPAERTTFVLNHPSPYGRLPKSQLAAALGIETVTEIAFGGEEVSRSGLEGFPVVMRRSGNPASRAISAVAHRLDREAQEALALR